jgi:hypothetical protein
MEARRRFTQRIPFEDRLTAFANEVLQEARTLPLPERDVLLRKVKKAQAAKEMDAWANAPDPRPLPVCTARK